MKPTLESRSEALLGSGGATVALLGALRPGDVLNETFRLAHVVAEGGMGVVYLATHERLPGLFAVKTLRADMPDDPNSVARLLQEARVLASLNHPNIVNVFDLNVTPTGTPYLVMEYLEGRNLNEILYGRVLQPWEVVEIVRQVACALAAAHGRQVIHRDLKPENVLLVSVPGQDDLIKLIDFGVSKVEWAGRIDTRSGLVGTPHYMAPEQANGQRSRVDARADQFALAVMTYEMLAGVRPFSDDNPVAVLHQIVNDPPPPLAGLVAWPLGTVERVLGRGMAKDPDARFASVAAYADALADAVAADVGGGRGALDLVAGHERALLVGGAAADRVRPDVFSRLVTQPVPAPPRSRAGTPSSGVPTSLSMPTRRRRGGAPVASGVPTNFLGTDRWRRGARAPLIILVGVAAAVGTYLLRPRAQPLLDAWRGDRSGRASPGPSAPSDAGQRRQ